MAPAFQHSSIPKFQSGNALWFILVAVVLLGALTVLLTRSGSSVTQSGDVEQLRLTASQMMRYARGLESAIDQMKMRGTSESDISFEHGGAYVNANCGVSSCKVFESGGGGETYRPPPTGAGAADWIFTGANNVGTTANPVGTTAVRSGNDLLIMLANVRQDLCVQINRDLGVGTPGTLPVDTTGIAVTPFDGTYPGGGPSVLDGDPTPFELDGKRGGCFIDAAPNPDVIYFYYVLLAR